MANFLLEVLGSLLCLFQGDASKHFQKLIWSIFAVISRIFWNCLSVSSVDSQLLWTAGSTGWWGRPGSCARCSGHAMLWLLVSVEMHRGLRSSSLLVDVFLVFSTSVPRGVAVGKCGLVPVTLNALHGGSEGQVKSWHSCCPAWTRS